MTTSVSKAKRYDKNPFVQAEAQYKTSKKRTVVKGGKVVFDRETNTVENTAELVTCHQVDAEQFVKLYTKDLKQLFSLTASAMRLLQLVLNQVQQNIGKDTILLNVPIMERYFTELDVKPMSRPTFYRCLGEMIDKAFLAPTTDSRDLFFINPNLFFNGDRVRLVKEYHITRQGNFFVDTTPEALEKDTKDEGEK